MRSADLCDIRCISIATLVTMFVVSSGKGSLLNMSAGGFHSYQEASQSPLRTLNQARSTSYRTPARTKTLILHFIDSKTYLAVEHVFVLGGTVTTNAPELKLLGDTGPGMTLKLPLAVGQHYAFEIRAAGYKAQRFDIAAATSSPFTLALHLSPLQQDANFRLAQSHVYSDGEILYGYALDFSTHRPLRGVRVRVLSRQASTMTDANGFYSLELPVSETIGDDDQTQKVDIRATLSGYMSYTYPELRLERGSGNEPLNLPLIRGKGTSRLPWNSQSDLGTGPNDDAENGPESQQPKKPTDLDRWLDADL